jgi:niacin transporter
MEGIMKNRIFLQKLTAVVLLIAIGIIIAIFSPVRFIRGSASFTPAVHTPIFVAVFISPLAAVTVALGTALGFLFGGFPPVIFWRAVSHVLFALLAASYLHYKPYILSSVLKTQGVSLVIGIIHAWVEVIVVFLFYMDSGTSGFYFTPIATFLLVGLGGIVHSMVDMGFALIIVKLLAMRESLKPIFVNFEEPRQD